MEMLFGSKTFVFPSAFLPSDLLLTLPWAPIPDFLLFPDQHYLLFFLYFVVRNVINLRKTVINLRKTVTM